VEPSTFRAGLLTATPATSNKARSASTPGYSTGECRPFSLFFPELVFCSCLIGLEGNAGSLLGWGLKALVNAFFENDVWGVVFAVVAGDGAGLGEFVDFF
jgi:hypothetical protein